MGDMKLHRTTNAIMQGVTGLVYLAGLPFALASGVLPRTWGRMRKTPRPDEDWIVVLGCGYVIPDMLNARVDAAVETWRTKPDCKLILSGAETGFSDEPAYMAARCVSAGVPERQLLRDGHGYTTKKTMENVARAGVKRAMVVSSDYHIRRCVYQARRAGIDAVGLDVPRVKHPRRWWYWLREAGAMAKAVVSRYEQSPNVSGPRLELQPESDAEFAQPLSFQPFGPIDMLEPWAYVGPEPTAVPAAGKQVRVLVLYPQLTANYGDCGNVLLLQRELEARGCEVLVEEHGLGATPPTALYDAYLIGGAMPHERELIADDLRAGMAGHLAEAVDAGSVLLAVAGGLAALGDAGVLPIHAEPGDMEPAHSYAKLLVPGGEGELLAGYQIHSERYYLDNPRHALARTSAGYGNNGEDGTEGVHVNNAYGTTLHGPVLMRSRWLLERLVDDILKQSGELGADDA